MLHPVPGLSSGFFINDDAADQVIQAEQDS
jgi:hypothetical protein